MSLLLESVTMIGHLPGIDSVICISTNNNMLLVLIIHSLPRWSKGKGGKKSLSMTNILKQGGTQRLKSLEVSK